MRHAVIAAVAAPQLVFASPTHAEEVVRDSAAWPIAQALIANERTAWDAYARRDGAAPDLLSSDYVDLLPGGEINDRAGHLAAIAEADLPSYSLDGFRVMRLSVDAMRVTYAVDWAYSTGETERVAVTSGGALRDGQWLNASYRETPLA